MSLKSLSIRMAAGALVLAAPTVFAEGPAASVPPAPSAGLLNDFLRRHSDSFTNWDIGGAIRERYEVHEGYGIAGVPGSVDFRDHGADVSNDYLLSRIRFHLGYSESWWGALAEGRSSLESGDQRFASLAPVPRRGDGPESDSIDLHQGFVT